MAEKCSHSAEEVVVAEDRSCKTTEELNDLCGTHTFQSVKSILNYVNQLQREQLSFEEERKETKQLRAKVQELELKLAEGKSNENLISSQDTHIKDLQATISILQNSNFLQQNVESVNAEIDKLKSFIKEELTKELSKINFRNYEDQLKSNNKTISEYAAQMESKETTLKTCQLNLKETQSFVSEYKDQLENTIKTIAENTAKISQLEAQVSSREKTLKETQVKLIESEDELKKQKQANVEKEAKETELNEQIRKLKEIPTSGTCFGYSNLHNVKLPNFESFPVVCNSEIAGPGWTVIQQRLNGRENFYRNWKDYKNGFGDFTGDFFLGLEKIHRLTNEKPHELYIHMEAFKGGHYKNSSFYIRYDNFRIAGEDDKYRLLSLGTFSGSAGRDVMRHSERAQFSTFDSDNDVWKEGHCTSDHHAGWWYNACAYCHINGKYYQKEANKADSMSFDLYYSLKSVKMLIRPRSN